jgi:hypothetical protein
LRSDEALHVAVVVVAAAAGGVEDENSHCKQNGLETGLPDGSFSYQKSPFGGSWNAKYW